MPDAWTVACTECGVDAGEPCLNEKGAPLDSGDDLAALNEDGQGAGDKWVHSARLVHLEHSDRDPARKSQMYTANGVDTLAGIRLRAPSGQLFVAFLTSADTALDLEALPPEAQRAAVRAAVATVKSVGEEHVAPPDVDPL